MSAARSLVAHALRHPAASPPADEQIPAILAAARHHRVLVLLGAVLRHAGTLGEWPCAFRTAFAADEREAAAIDCIRHRELISLLEACRRRGVRALLFKGAALAHTHYPIPHARSRTDADLLIDDADRTAFAEIAASLGYTPQHETAGRLVSYQYHFGRRDRYGVFHALDVHWRISNRHLLADRIGFEELWQRRISLPALGEGAVTVGAVDALLLAIVHRAGHHPGSTNLLWMYDIHLLVGSMSASELHALADRSIERSLAGIVAEGLAGARDTFGIAAVDGVIDRLASSPRGTDAPTIKARWRQAGIVSDDLRALTTWTERSRLVREHLFPPSSYIRGKYGVRSAWALPALYAWRIVAGAPAWLRRHDEAD